MSKKPDPELIDADNPEWTDEMFEQSARFDGLPTSLQAKLRGRPKAAVTKEPTTIRFDADVLAALRATGPGWQTRVNAAMREWVKTQGGV